MKLYLDSSVLGFAIGRRDLQRRREANHLLSQIRAGLFEGGYSYRGFAATEEFQRTYSSCVGNICTRFENNHPVRFYVTETEVLAAPPHIAERLRKKIRWARLHRLHV